MGSCTADCGSLIRCTAVGEADGAEKEIYFIIDGVILTYIAIHGII